MPNYVLYRDDLETIEPDEAETNAKIIQVMTDGQNIVREKLGKAVRISHAKAHGMLRGEVLVRDDLPAEAGAGAVRTDGKYLVVMRLASAPGELTDDAKISTVRGWRSRYLMCRGRSCRHLTGSRTRILCWIRQGVHPRQIEGFSAGVQAECADCAEALGRGEGGASDIARGTNAALKAAGLNSEKMDFYGHQKKHPMAESYFSQTPFRYGDYVAKIGVLPVSPGLLELEDKEFNPKTPDALRDATVAFFKAKRAEFEVAVQLNTDLETMPIEDAMASGRRRSRRTGRWRGW